MIAGLRGEIRLLTSISLLEELERVLIRKFGLDHRLVDDLLDLLKNATELIDVTSRIKVIQQVDDDNRILECAYDGKADFIVTGDTKHILPLKNFRGIRILSPFEFTRRFPNAFR